VSEQDDFTEIYTNLNTAESDIRTALLRNIKPEVRRKIEEAYHAIGYAKEAVARLERRRHERQ
jgi:DNA-binding LacI/PurR family transcriptional regulator